MNLSIIEANVSHIAAIATIGKQSFYKAFAHLFNNKEELLEYLEFTYSHSKLSRSIKKGNNVYFLALLDGQPVGFAKVKINSLNENIETVAQMEMQKIYVLPDHQDNGVGTVLLKEVKKMAKEISPDYIWLDTYINNEKAIRFYERNGFNKVGKQYFTIGSQTFDYYVMGMPVAFKVASGCK